MDIQVGEYIRTKEGYIAKCIDIEPSNEVDDKKYIFDSKIDDERNCELFDDGEEYISKHSFDIMDLLEDGDIADIKYKGYTYRCICEDMCGMKYFTSSLHIFTYDKGKWIDDGIEMLGITCHEKVTENMNWLEG